MDNKKYFKLLADYDKHCQRIAQATSLEIHETETQRFTRMKKLEKDYILWFEYYFPNYAKKKCAWFHRKLADIVVNNKRLRLLAEIYRSGAKSVHIDLGLPLYLYLALGDLHFMLLLGETEIKAKKLISGIQAELEYNNRIKNDYGEKFHKGSWADGDFATSDGVRFMALGFGQNPRGARENADRPDYIVVDDVDSKKHVNNDRLMRESVDFITEDIWGTFDTDEVATERFIYANNNFHKNSITNRLKKYFTEVITGEKDDEDDESEDDDGFADTHFEVLTVCAVKNLIDFTPEWSEKASSIYWKKKFKKMPYRSFMREYMHVHIEDGAIFQYENIHFKRAYALKDYEALCFYGDLSYKENADYKAMILVGIKGKEIHIIFSYMQQKSRAHCAKWLYDKYEEFNLEDYNIRYLIEGLFAMDEFINDFDNEGEKRDYYIPVVADKKAKGDKYDRIESLAGYFEGDNVFFNEYDKTSDQQTLIDQFLSFEKGSHAHDDGPDAVHGGIKNCSRRTRKARGSWASGQRQDHHY